MAASSTDGGTTWVYTIDSATRGLPTDYYSGVPIGAANGVFATSTCNGFTCIAAGAYENQATTIFPFLASSTNGGATWTFPISSGTLPHDYSDGGIIYGVVCTGQVCIAVGGYNTTSLNNPIYPFIAKSDNYGVTWRYTLDDSTTPAAPPGYSNNAVFGSVSCTKSNCIAAGSYGTQTGIYPMLATSVDGGDTWTYTIDSQTYPSVPTDFKNFGAFSSASCSGFTCIAAGVYTTSTHPSINYPLLASSKDAGLTWIYTIDSQTTPSAPPGFTTFGTFNSTSCNGLICVAAGQYLGQLHYPLIASSTDGGLSWVYSLNNTQPMLPNDYVNAGNFSSASISSDYSP